MDCSATSRVMWMVEEEGVRGRGGKGGGGGGGGVGGGPKDRLMLVHLRFSPPLPLAHSPRLFVHSTATAPPPPTPSAPCGHRHRTWLPTGRAQPGRVRSTV